MHGFANVSRDNLAKDFAHKFVSLAINSKYHTLWKFFADKSEAKRYRVKFLHSGNYYSVRKSTNAIS